MRYPGTIISCDADGAVQSYLAELRKIAVTFQSLTRTTMARLKVAHILVGSRRVRNREFDQAPEHVECDEEEDEDQDLEYDLLPSNRVAIADDTIALQQFGEEIFCAPQEDTLEGEHGSTYFLYPTPTQKTQVSTSLLAVNGSVNLLRRNIKQRKKPTATRQLKRSGL